LSIDKYIVVPDSEGDDDYWEALFYEKMDIPSRKPQVGLNSVVVMTSYRDSPSSDVCTEHYYWNDNELEQYRTYQYLYWNGLRVFEDRSIEQIRGYGDGGPEIVYCAKYGGKANGNENGDPSIFNAHQEMLAAEKKAKEDAKIAAKAERAAKKAAKEKADYERLRVKFE
jgi:hypothetical protein